MSAVSEHDFFFDAEGTKYEIWVQNNFIHIKYKELNLHTNEEFETENMGTHLQFTYNTVPAIAATDKAAELNMPVESTVMTPYQYGTNRTNSVTIGFPRKLETAGGHEEQVTKLREFFRKNVQDRRISETQSKNSRPKTNEVDSEIHVQYYDIIKFECVTGVNDPGAGPSANQYLVNL
jgi:hypothetical protein